MNGLYRSRPLSQQARIPKAPVDSHLAALNDVLSKIEEDGIGDAPVSHYAMESIERPRRRIGPMIAKRLSYVEHSYNRLTNDVYSENSLIGPSETNTTNLSAWAHDDN